MALFGLQGLSSRHDSVRMLMDMLVPFVRIMPPPSGKVLGMALQGFKACGGRPSSSHAEVLTILAHKLPGWSLKGGSGGGGSGSSKMFTASADAQVCNI
jgi:hypothetical protein